jgi:hypothetical protein
LAVLGIAEETGDDELVRHGLRSLLARELAEVRGESIVLDPRLAAVGAVLARPEHAVTVLTGTRPPGCTHIVDGASVRVLVGRASLGLAEVRLLDAAAPLGELLAGAVRAALRTESCSGVVVAVGTGAVPERGVAFGTEEDGSVTRRTWLGPDEKPVSRILLSELHPTLDDLLEATTGSYGGTGS